MELLLATHILLIQNTAGGTFGISGTYTTNNNSGSRRGCDSQLPIRRLFAESGW